MKRPILTDYNLTDTDSLLKYVMAWNEYSNLLKNKLDNIKRNLIEICEIEQDNDGDPLYVLTQDNLDELINK